MSPVTIARIDDRSLARPPARKLALGNVRGPPADQGLVTQHPSNVTQFQPAGTAEARLGIVVSRATIHPDKDVKTGTFASPTLPAYALRSMPDSATWLPTQPAAGSAPAPHRAGRLLFSRLSRHELLRITHLAIGKFSRAATPSKR